MYLCLAMHKSVRKCSHFDGFTPHTAKSTCKKRIRDIVAKPCEKCIRICHQLCLYAPERERESVTRGTLSVFRISSELNSLFLFTSFDFVFRRPTSPPLISCKANLTLFEVGLDFQQSVSSLFLDTLYHF
jgi:hypothetical protein